MQRDREVRENANRGGPFDSFGGFGFPGNIFGGNDPFDDPFFTRPLGSLHGSNMFDSNGPAHERHTSKSRGPVIKELDSDDEDMIEGNEEGDTGAGAGAGAGWANRNPLVEHPEDQADDHGKSNNNSDHKDISYITNHDRAEGSQPRSRSVNFQRVTYGGIDGAYYTATSTRKTGSDGVTLEESKQADRTTGQAAHRISRGIHDKGLSVTRKLDSDGKVDTMQTLHNLNEDELTGFEQAWRGNSDRHFRGSSDNFFSDNPKTGSEGRGQLTSWEGFSDPFREHFNRTDRNFQAQSSMGRPKKVVRINIE